MITWSMKEKGVDGWQPVPVAILGGMTLRQALEWMHGRELVAEFIIGGSNFYFCGTDHWKQRMNKKGKAVMAQEAIELLAASKPELLEEVCPGEAADAVNSVERIFGPGCELEKMGIQEKLT